MFTYPGPVTSKRLPKWTFKMQCTFVWASPFPRALTLLFSMVLWGVQGNPTVGIPLFPCSQFPSLEHCGPERRQSQEERQEIHIPFSCRGSAPQYATFQELKTWFFWEEDEKLLLQISSHLRNSKKLLSELSKIIFLNISFSCYISEWSEKKRLRRTTSLRFVMS